MAPFCSLETGFSSTNMACKHLEFSNNAYAILSQYPISCSTLSQECCMPIGQCWEMMRCQHKSCTQRMIRFLINIYHKWCYFVLFHRLWTSLIHIYRLFITQAILGLYVLNVEKGYVLELNLTSINYIYKVHLFFKTGKAKSAFHYSVSRTR